MKEVLDALEAAAASLETVLVCFGPQMTPADKVGRHAVLREAEQILEKHGRREPQDSQ